jgi:hypothetical protein
LARKDIARLRLQTKIPLLIKIVVGAPHIGDTPIALEVVKEQNLRVTRKSNVAGILTGNAGISFREWAGHVRYPMLLNQQWLENNHRKSY